jgi:hypothetical protein
MFSRRTLLLGAAAHLVPLRALAARATVRSGVAGQAIYGEPVYSESAYFDLVSDDGETGFIARIGRYPSLGKSWLWGHAFDREGMCAFTTEDGPSTAEATDLDRASVSYAASSEGATLLLSRQGLRAQPRQFTAEVSFEGHSVDRSTSAGDGGHPPHGPGSVPVSLTASLQPGHPPATNLSGRTEVLGQGTCQLRIGERTHHLEARGHFHEQTQERPRFVNPFVYATLRGPGFYSVAIKIEAGAVGFAWIDDRTFAVTAFEIDAPQETAASKRRYRLELHDEQGDEQGGEQQHVEAELDERHLYSVPIYDGRRRGTLVTGKLAGPAATDSPARTISGCVNDHLPARLDYTPRGGQR